MNASSPSTNKTLAVERNQRVSHRQLATAYNCRLAAEGVIGGEHSTFGVRGQAQRDTALDPPVGGESKAPSTLRSAGALHKAAVRPLATFCVAAFNLPD